MSVYELGDLRDLVEAPKLTLPIGGKKFVIDPCSGETWLKLQAFAEFLEGKREVGVESALSDTELYSLALGEKVYAQIIRHATGPEIQKAGMTAFFWQTGNGATAEAYWNSGGKAPKPRRSRSTSTSTGAASTSRKPASGSGTRSRRPSSGS